MVLPYRTTAQGYPQAVHKLSTGAPQPPPCGSPVVAPRAETNKYKKRDNPQKMCFSMSYGGGKGWGWAPFRLCDVEPDGLFGGQQVFVALVAVPSPGEAVENVR